MSLFGSLFSGVSGLTAQSQSMSMISDNVANVNTTAYKGAEAQFSSLVTRAPSSTTYNPGGVRSQSFYRIDTQGLIQNSDSATDIAIQGAGFYVVNDVADSTGERLYSRDGAFGTDEVGNLRIPSGYYLQGWLLDVNEQIVDINTLETVNVQAIQGLAVATTNVGIGANLDADQVPFAGYAGGDMADHASSGGVAGVQPHFTRAIQVFDSLGQAHNITAAFLNDPALNTWNVEFYGDPAEIDTAATGAASGLLASGTINFGGDGSLAATNITPSYPGGAVAGAPIGIPWLSGALDSSIQLDLGSLGGTDGLTQFAAESAVSIVDQNGAEVGLLNSVSIDEDGYVVAGFSNGQSRRIYKVPIATFPNPAALDPRSGNIYSETDRSGVYNLNHAGVGGAGKIVPSALEAANVDLADEFTKMIVTQRAYSANARVITTTDEMLDELIRISR